MALRGIARWLGGRRLGAASHATDAARAVLAGRRWSAFKLLAVAAISYRWRAAGMAFELGRRLFRRAR